MSSAARASSVPVGALPASDRSTNTENSRSSGAGGGGGGNGRLYTELLGSSLEHLHFHERLLPPPLGLGAEVAPATGLQLPLGFGSAPTLKLPPPLMIPVPAHIIVPPGGAMSSPAIAFYAGSPILVPPFVPRLQDALVSSATTGATGGGAAGTSARSGTGTEVFTPVTTPRESLDRKLSELSALTQRVRTLQRDRARIVGELHAIRVQLSVNQVQIDQLLCDEQQRIDRIGGASASASKSPTLRAPQETEGEGGGRFSQSQVPPLRLHSSDNSAAGTPRTPTPGTSTARSIAEAEAERERLLYHLRGLGQQLEARRTEFEALQGRLRDCVHDIEGLETLGLSRDQVSYQYHTSSLSSSELYF